MVETTQPSKLNVNTTRITQIYLCGLHVQIDFNVVYSCSCSVIREINKKYRFHVYYTKFYNKDKIRILGLRAKTDKNILV